MRTKDPEGPPAPPWEEALFSLLHPVQVATVEAYEWIGEPMSPRLVYEVFGRTWPVGTVAYHVRRLASQGVLRERYREPARGTVAHYYQLAR